MFVLMTVSLQSCSLNFHFPENDGSSQEQGEKPSQEQGGQNQTGESGNTENSGNDGEGDENGGAGNAGTGETDSEGENPAGGENPSGGESAGTGTQEGEGSGTGSGNEGENQKPSPEEEEVPDPVTPPVSVLGTDMIFAEDGQRIEIEIPSGWTGYAVLMNDGTGWKDDSFQTAYYTIEGMEDKAITYSTGKTSPEYAMINGTERLVWKDMPKSMGGRCNAYEYGRDDRTGIIYMFDTAMSSSLQKKMGDLLDTLYFICPEALPHDSLRKAEENAGTVPLTLFTENGKRYLFVLFTDLGEGMESTLGVYGTVFQIYGTYPAVNINAGAFSPTNSDAWKLATTTVHEYSHFLESHLRMEKTGRPGFGPHLLSEGYADWSALVSAGHSKTEEANYIAFWMQAGNMWHPVREYCWEDGNSLRLADYGLGCLLWDRIAHENGSAGVKAVIGSAKDDFSGVEKVTGKDFGTWFDRSAMDVLLAVGADDGSGRDVSYLDDYRLRWVWDCVSNYIGESPVGKGSVKMTRTGIRMIRLPSSAYAFTATGADRCVLFALENVR